MPREALVLGCRDDNLWAVEHAPHLFGLLPEDLVAALNARGVACQPAEARRVLGRVISEGDLRLREMKKPVAAVVRDATLALPSHRLDVVERALDEADGFVKYLLRLADGALIEAVRIPLHKPGHYTVCLSSQVGCAMGCSFCATGRLGLRRHLAAWEMVAQVIAVRDDLPAGERISGCVFMGQGEPLHNYDAVIQAARVLSNPCGGRIEAKNISVSTVGLAPQILRYAQEGHRFRLIISLHSAQQEKRRGFLPIANKHGLDELAAAIRAYHEATNDRVTIAWTMMSGVNTGRDEVDALRALLAGVPLRINLIDVNDPRADGYRPPSAAELGRFLDDLQLLGQPIVRRYSGGRNKHAACGMLAATTQASAIVEPQG